MDTHYSIFMSFHYIFMRLDWPEVWTSWTRGRMSRILFASTALPVSACSGMSRGIQSGRARTFQAQSGSPVHPGVGHVLFPKKYIFIRMLHVSTHHWQMKWTASHLFAYRFRILCQCPYHLHCGQFLPLLGSAQKPSDFGDIWKVHTIQSICFLYQCLYGTYGGPFWKK